MEELFLQHGRPGEPMSTEKVPHKIQIMEWQKSGLSYTASGYGARIPTRYMVFFNGRWRRVYCCIYSNVGTLFIGKNVDVGIRVTAYEL